MDSKTVTKSGLEFVSIENTYHLRNLNVIQYCENSNEFFVFITNECKSFKEYKHALAFALDQLEEFENSQEGKILDIFGNLFNQELTHFRFKVRYQIKRDEFFQVLPINQRFYPLKGRFEWHDIESKDKLSGIRLMELSTGLNLNEEEN